jgi:hypothetical protein
MSDAPAGAAQPQPSARLGAATLERPLETLNTENISSFRAVSKRRELDESLGLLADLPGRWYGTGFNLIARPDFAGDNDIFLELNETTETLDFTTIGSAIPNRGSQQGDIELYGLTYLQQITDKVTGGALHIEPGIWINIPATTVPNAGGTIARLASIPHGDVINVQGTGLSVAGGPTIAPANTVPFPIGTPTPPPGTPNPFFEYDLANDNPFRTTPVPPGVTQAIVDDPNTVLRNALVGQNVTETVVLEVSTAPTGGVENIPFIVHNADAAFVSATFWIETITHPYHGTFMQLQYTQTVLLNFDTLSWPHVSVATLLKGF